MIYSLDNVYYNGLAIPMEFWKPITDEMVPGVRPIYYISNIGNLYNSELGRYSSASIKENDYVRVILRAVDGKQISTTIHRLVALAFLGMPPNKNMEVDHINCDRTCSLENNLEWVSKYENCIRAHENGRCKTGEDYYNSIFTNKEVEDICKMLESGMSISEIADIMDERIKPRVYKGGCRSIIVQIYDGVIWKNISKKYTFPSNAKSQFNSKQVDEICIALKNNYSYDYIIDNVLKMKTISDSTRINLKERLYNIKRGRSFKEISSKYLL